MVLVIHFVKRFGKVKENDIEVILSSSIFVTLSSDSSRLFVQNLLGTKPSCALESRWFRTRNDKMSAFMISSSILQTIDVKLIGL